MGIFKKPPLKNYLKRKTVPDGHWQKCPRCSELLHLIELDENNRVCRHCDHHFMLGARKRIQMLADPESFVELDNEMVSKNPLSFEQYSDKIQAQKEKSQLNDAVITGKLTLAGFPCVVAVMDFSFFAGSMGSVVGEKIARAIETATREKRAILIFSSSSGARMQEGMFSLMQMAKTTATLARHSEAKLPYISIMTHPTTGGVTASFATIGDINFAEPRCMIGFAGPRVVKETTHQNLPSGFQTAEFMMKHGLIDKIVPRDEMGEELVLVLTYLLPN